MRREHLAPVVTILLITLFLLTIYFPALAKTPDDPMPALRAVVEAERAFAQMSLDKGMKDAFLANLAADAIVFRPGPVPAIEFFRSRPATTGTLSWEPDFAGVSSQGDLGYTSGPWEWREKDATSGAHGHFVSVWRRQLDGSYKVAIDTGVQHDAPSGPVEVTYSRPMGITRVPPVEPAAERANVLEADRKLAGDSAAKSWVEIWQSRAADDVRWYRAGSFPVVGKDAVRKAQAARPGSMTWMPIAAEASDLGDVGYTYGTAEFRPEGAPADSVDATAYVRIWRKREDGGREIVVDVASPMPSPKRVAKP